MGPEDDNDNDDDDDAFVRARVKPKTFCEIISAFFDSHHELLVFSL